MLWHRKRFPYDGIGVFENGNLDTVDEGWVFHQGRRLRVGKRHVQVPMNSVMITMPAVPAPPAAVPFAAKDHPPAPPAPYPLPAAPVEVVALGVTGPPFPHGELAPQPVGEQKTVVAPIPEAP